MSSTCISSNSEHMFVPGTSSRARIRSLRDHVGKVELPLRSGQYINDIVLEALVKRGRFPSLCEAAFGQLIVTDASPPLCWLDEANNDPRSELASDLFDLLKPEGMLFAIMQEVSAPQSEFKNLLGPRKWKTSTPPTDQLAPYGASFPVSLSLLGSKTSDVVEAGVDLTSAAGVHPGLLIPFWFPPIVHTPDAPVIPDRECIHCTMLGYFFIRLVMYGAERAHAAAEDVLRVALQPRSGVESLLGESAAKLVYTVQQWTSKWTTSQKPASTFPFYHRLLQAYVVYFLKNPIVSKIARAKSFNEISWSVSEVTAAQLAFLPTQVWLRGFASVEFECNRSPIIDENRDRSLMQMARLSIAAEYVRGLYAQLTAAAPLANDEVPMPRARHQDPGVAASLWVHRLHRHVERTSMIIIRQLSLSLPRLPCVRPEHLRSVVDLWTSLVRPLTTNELVQRHYEAISLLTDVLRMLSEPSVDLDRALDEPFGASVCAALAVLSTPSVQWILQELSQANKTRKANTEGLRAYYLLDWSDTGNDEVEPVTTSAAIFATRLYAKLQRSAVLQLSKARNDVMQCLAAAFPDSSTVPDTNTELPRQPQPALGLSAEGEANKLSERTLNHPIMTAKERALFLQGRGITRWSPEARLIRFKRGTFLEPAGPISNEFPILLPLVEVMDAAADAVQSWRFSGRLPKCLRGHLLRLVDSDVPACSQHSEQKAVWQCPTCNIFFGTCCKNHKPRDFDGGELKRIDCSDRTCDRCFLALLGPHIAYENSDTKAFLCNYCACEPYPKVSFRWIASYQATLLLIVLVLAYGFFAFVIENI